MKKAIFILWTITASLLASAQASSQENLRRATAREIGGNTRTADVVVTNIKRKMTSVTWNAQANGVCYECDADDMVRSVHIVKVDCALVPAEPKKKAEVSAGSTIGNTNPPASTSVPDAGQCGKYRRMKTIGVALSVGGGATLLASVILLALGTRTSYDYLGYPYRSRTGAYTAGAVLIVPATLAAGAGVPLWVIGAKKSKGCGSSPALSAVSSPSGVSLALQF
ncbi:MAG: hypothetical protein JST76_12255 [Bacteroidetes bacterium]|nr:hypothetical protein [Bacteroidota bacterium]